MSKRVESVYVCKLSSPYSALLSLGKQFTSLWPYESGSRKMSDNRRVTNAKDIARCRLRSCCEEYVCYDYEKYVQGIIGIVSMRYVCAAVPGSVSSVQGVLTGFLEIMLLGVCVP